MARPRPSQSVKPTKTDIQQLSSEVLRLRLQQLNLPITGSRTRLIERLRSATTPQAASQGRPLGCRSAGRVAKPKSTKRGKTRNTQASHGTSQPHDVDVPASDEEPDSTSVAGSSVEEMLCAQTEDIEDQQPGDILFSPAQMSVIQETVSSSVREAMLAFHHQDVSPRSITEPRTQRTSSFLASGVPPFNAQSSPQPVAPQGRQMLSVPSFISTFAPPRSAIPSLAIATGTSPSVPSPVSSASLGLPSSVQQPFVLPPGFTPVPAKTVSQILAGKFIDLGDLLSANITEKEPESQVYFGSHLVVTPSAKKHRRKIDDIVSWSEAFSIFMLILTSYFPHRWKDLTCYKLLILQTQRHFSGRVWCAYDLAFRQHAAATKLVDWSSMNSELFNFHAAGASLRPSASGTSPDVPEPSGAPSSQIICRSWNRGRGRGRGPSTTTADTPIVAASAPALIAVPSVPFAQNLPPGATTNALLHLPQLPPLPRRPDVIERRTCDAFPGVH